MTVELSRVQAKFDRITKTLRHEEADRVPISDFFWGDFVARWRQELDLPKDADPYRYYDLDYIVVNPNMDPHINSTLAILDERERGGRDKTE